MAVLRQMVQSAKISHLEIQSAKNPFQGAKIFFKVRKCSRLQNGLLKCFYFSMGCKNVFSFPFGCKTWPPSYEMASKIQNDVQKHFAKPREIAKMPIEPHDHASKEESPLTEITHTKPLTPFLTDRKSVV